MSKTDEGSNDYLSDSSIHASSSKSTFLNEASKFYVKKSESVESLKNICYESNENNQRNKANSIDNRCIPLSGANDQSILVNNSKEKSVSNNSLISQERMTDGKIIQERELQESDFASTFNQVPYLTKKFPKYNNFIGENPKFIIIIIILLNL